MDACLGFLHLATDIQIDGILKCTTFFSPSCFSVFFTLYFGIPAYISMWTQERGAWKQNRKQDESERQYRYHHMEERKEKER